MLVGGYEGVEIGFQPEQLLFVGILPILLLKDHLLVLLVLLPDKHEFIVLNGQQGLQLSVESGHFPLFSQFSFQKFLHILSSISKLFQFLSFSDKNLHILFILFFLCIDQLVIGFKFALELVYFFNCGFIALVGLVDVVLG